MDAQKLIEAFVKIRDKRAELKKVYDTEDEKLKEGQNKIKVMLLQQMESVGSEQLKGKAGTAYKQLVQRFGASDWNLVWEFILQNQRLDMLEKRLGQKTMADYLEQTGDMPPGVSLHQEYDVVIRRS